MKSWKEVKLGDIGKIITGKTPRTKIKENFNGDILFLTPSDDMSNKYIENTNRTINEKGLKEVKNCLLPKNSICTSCIGSDLGKTVITTKKTVTNQQINSIILNSDIDCNFIYYSLVFLEDKLKFIGKTSTALPIINKTNFSNIKINLPPLPQQKAIAQTLSCIDEKIELNNKINKNLEEMAQAIFKKWFIDFDYPLTEEEKAKGGREFIDSELGKIPKGWKVVELGEVCDIHNGYTYKSSELINSNIALATIKNFERKGGFKVDGFKEIKPIKNIKQNQCVDLYDIIVAHTDLTQNADIIGNAEMILNKSSYGKIIISMDIVKVTSKSLSKFIVLAILKNKKFKSYALGYINGTTVLHLNKKAIPKYKVAIPFKIEILEDLQDILQKIYIKISDISIENEKLKEIRDTLLPKLINGEIIVPIK